MKTRTMLILYLILAPLAVYIVAPTLVNEIAAQQLAGLAAMGIRP